jgi:hypothetical protein
MKNIELKLEKFLKIEGINYYLKSNYKLKEYIENEKNILVKIVLNVDFFNNKEQFENSNLEFEFEIDKEETTKLISLELKDLQISVIDNQGIQVYYIIDLKAEKIIMEKTLINEDIIEEKFIEEETIIEKENIEEIKQSIVEDVNTTLSEVFNNKISINTNKRDTYIDFLKEKNQVVTIKFIKNEQDIEKISNQYKIPLEDLYKQNIDYNMRSIVIYDSKNNKLD